MTYTPVRTDDGIEVRDGNGDVIVVTDTWPPREAKVLETLFEEANVSTPQKELFEILFGVAGLKDERSNTSDAE